MSEQSVTLQLEAINAKVDRLIDGLFGSKFAEGRIPTLERVVEGHTQQLGEHGDAIEELQDARKEEVIKSGLTLTYKQKLFALAAAAPPFIYYSIKIAETLGLMK